jgi:hypothetical protein
LEHCWQAQPVSEAWLDPMDSAFLALPGTMALAATRQDTAMPAAALAQPEAPTLPEATALTAASL